MNSKIRYLVPGSAVLALAVLSASLALGKTRITSKPEDHQKDGNQGLIAEIKDVNLYKVSTGFLFAVKLELTNDSGHDSDIEDARMFLNTNSGPMEVAVPFVYDGSLPKLITGKEGSYAFPDSTAVSQLSPLMLSSEKKNPAIKAGDSLNTDASRVWKKGEKFSTWIWGNYLYEPGSKDELSVALYDFRRTTGKFLKKPRLRVSTFLYRYIK
ncbi:MAG: hypothetical protein ACREJQ_00605, partial [bacterium]